MLSENQGFLSGVGHSGVSGFLDVVFLNNVGPRNMPQEGPPIRNHSLERSLCGSGLMSAMTAGLDSLQFGCGRSFSAGMDDSQAVQAGNQAVAD